MHLSIAGLGLSRSSTPRCWVRVEVRVEVRVRVEVPSGGWGTLVPAIIIASQVCTSGKLD